MAGDNKISPDSGDDKILNKLEALLRKRQGKPSAVAGMADVDGAAATLPVLTQIPDAAPEQSSSSPGPDKIPTLTETMPLPPASPSLKTELRQILEAALLETEIDLDAAAREALIHALEWRLRKP